MPTASLGLDRLTARPWMFLQTGCGSVPTASQARGPEGGETHHSAGGLSPQTQPLGLSPGATGSPATQRTLLLEMDAGVPCQGH